MFLETVYCCPKYKSGAAGNDDRRNFKRAMNPYYQYRLPAEVLHKEKMSGKRRASCRFQTAARLFPAEAKIPPIKTMNDTLILFSAIVKNIVSCRAFYIRRTDRPCDIVFCHLHIAVAQNASTNSFGPARWKKQPSVRMPVNIKNE